ncbi:aspartate ammonia-lyase [Neobacillus bataviensis LMG 21833]|uniref:Aspartate ammonia-lyase n=1 Tax=Neobacillus bataviensis LMG 21833 TaxID=1117379 RepID=K6C5N3_9BACI|nr:aspartate ammonia-lyase [Neobacillus bataviensis]EKN66440.1 aspartate ammonia-lyase [Neobacillus bataviensis LMG 21833]
MRCEKDSIGELYLPMNVYYGIQTERARQNFRISGETIEQYPELIWCIAAIKKSAALSNQHIGVLAPDIADAIVKSADEVMAGKMSGHFPLDPYQGGGGTSINMNLNEVIANRANEFLGGSIGDELVHPNTDVNMGQSTNDVIPSAVNMTCFLYIQLLLKNLLIIKKSVEKKVQEFSEDIALARTCLQDAIPITRGQQFSGYLSFIERQIGEFEKLKSVCLSIPLGATAVGTSLGTYPGYIEAIYQFLPTVSGIPVEKKDNFFDGLQNADGYLKISSTLKGLATGLSKMAKDFRLLSSGPRAGFREIELPAVQAGSSIMPGKINPVIPEMMIQVCYQVYGNDQTVTMAVDNGELDINVWTPIIMKNLFGSFQLLTNAIPIFSEKCLEGVKLIRENAIEYAESSLSNATIVAALSGYKRATQIAEQAFQENVTIREVVIKNKLMQESDANQFLDPKLLTDHNKSSSLLSNYLHRNQSISNG